MSSIGQKLFAIEAVKRFGCLVALLEGIYSLGLGVAYATVTACSLLGPD
jgi:hypothetical protein